MRLLNLVDFNILINLDGIIQYIMFNSDRYSLEMAVTPKSQTDVHRSRVHRTVRNLKSDWMYLY